MAAQGTEAGTAGRRRAGKRLSGTEFLALIAAVEPAAVDAEFDNDTPPMLQPVMHRLKLIERRLDELEQRK